MNLWWMLVHVIYMGDDDNDRGNHYRYLQNKEITETVQQLQEIMNLEHKRLIYNMDPRIGIKRSRVMA